MKTNSTMKITQEPSDEKSKDLNVLEKKATEGEVSENLDDLYSDDADDDIGIKTVKLRKPINSDGQEVTIIILNMEDLTAGDLIRAEKEAKTRLKRSKGSLNIMKETDTNYTIVVAAKASGLKVEELQMLSARDFTTIHMAVVNFLLSGDL